MKPLKSIKTHTVNYRLGDWCAVQAKSALSEEELSGSEEEEEGRRKKPKKEKVGFRDRKVRKITFLRLDVQF